MDEEKNPEKLSNWESVDIFLFSNGQQYCPPRKYHLNTSDLEAWNATRRNLARMQYGTSNALIELYTLDGEKITGPMEVGNGVSYVAVEPPDAFIHAGYEKYLIKASRSWERRRSKRTNSVADPAISRPDSIKDGDKRRTPDKNVKGEMLSSVFENHNPAVIGIQSQKTTNSVSVINKTDRRKQTTITKSKNNTKVASLSAEMKKNSENKRDSLLKRSLKTTTRTSHDKKSLQQLNEMSKNVKGLKVGSRIPVDIVHNNTMDLNTKYSNIITETFIIPGNKIEYITANVMNSAPKLLSQKGIQTPIGKKSTQSVNKDTNEDKPLTKKSTTLTKKVDDVPINSDKKTSNTKIEDAVKDENKIAKTGDRCTKCSEDKVTTNENPLTLLTVTSENLSTVALISTVEQSTSTTSFEKKLSKNENEMTEFCDSCNKCDPDKITSKEQVLIAEIETPQKITDKDPIHDKPTKDENNLEKCCTNCIMDEITTNPIQNLTIKTKIAPTFDCPFECTKIEEEPKENDCDGCEKCDINKETTNISKMAVVEKPINNENDNSCDDCDKRNADKIATTDKLSGVQDPNTNSNNLKTENSIKSTIVVAVQKTDIKIKVRNNLADDTILETEDISADPVYEEMQLILDNVLEKIIFLVNAVKENHLFMNKSKDKLAYPNSTLQLSSNRKSCEKYLNNLASVDKGHVLNIKLSIEVKCGNEKTSGNDNLINIQSLTEIYKKDKESQVNIGIDVSQTKLFKSSQNAGGKSKSIQSMLLSEAANPIFFFFQCACCDRFDITDVLNRKKGQYVEKKSYIILLNDEATSDSAHDSNCSLQFGSTEVSSNLLLKIEENNLSRCSCKGDDATDAQTDKNTCSGQRRFSAIQPPAKQPACITLPVSELKIVTVNQETLASVPQIDTAVSPCCTQTGLTGDDVSGKRIAFVEDDKPLEENESSHKIPVPTISKCCGNCYEDNESEKIKNQDTQTDWGNIMLEARPDEQGRYMFFLPPLDLVKNYKL